MEDIDREDTIGGSLSSILDGAIIQWNLYGFYSSNLGLFSG